MNRLEKEENQKIRNLKKEQQELDKGGKAGKAKIYGIQLSATQRATTRKWFGCKRWIYNKCVHYSKSGTPTLQELRKRFAHNKNYQTENSWMLEYDYDLRDEAIRDFIHNLKTNFAKGDKFQLKFQSRKNGNESISVLAKKWNKDCTFYSSIFKPSVLKSSEPLPEKLLYTSRFKKTDTGKYFICIPEPLQVKSENQAPEKNCVFFDPGLFPILTGYDPSGKIYKFGTKDVATISRLLHYRKKLQSKIANTAGHAKKRNLKKAFLRLYDRISNLVNDFHCKTAKWLCENYTHIFLPKLNFHNLKKLNKRSKLTMATLRHCSLFDRIKDKTREYPWVTLIEVNESFTTKTCCKCGTQNHNVGSKKVFSCVKPICNQIIDRDVNGSINICLRYFTKRVVIRD